MSLCFAITFIAAAITFVIVAFRICSAFAVT